MLTVNPTNILISSKTIMEIPWEAVNRRNKVILFNHLELYLLKIEMLLFISPVTTDSKEETDINNIGNTSALKISKKLWKNIHILTKKNKQINIYGYPVFLY